MVNLKPVLVLAVVVGLLSCKPAQSDYDLRLARVETLKTTGSSAANLREILRESDFDVDTVPGKQYRADAKLAMSDGLELMWPIVKNESFDSFLWWEENIPFPGLYPRMIVVVVQSSGDVITKFDVR